MEKQVYIKNSEGLINRLCEELGLYAHISARLHIKYVPYLMIREGEVFGVTGNNIESEEVFGNADHFIKQYKYERRNR
jgi:hypothetical protein